MTCMMEEKPKKCEKPYVYPEDDMVLPWITRIGYGVGHVMNDLCSAMWFLYFLLILTKVNLLPDALAGGVIIVGQIADAIATPVIGVWSDRGTLGCLSRVVGKRRSWYLLGTVVVLMTVPFLYSPSIGFKTISHNGLAAYYAVFVVVFQFGWAAVQTVHLALATDLTPLESERTLLLSLRNTGTSISNLAVPTIFLGIQACSGFGSEISPVDSYQFQYLMGIVLCIGLVLSSFAGFAMREDNIDEPDNERLAPETTEQVGRRTYGQIFGKFNFYKIALLYTSSRMFGNILQTFVSLYLIETLSLSAMHVTAIPLVLYTASTITSVMAERLIVLVGRKSTYVFGMIPGVIASVWIYLGPGFLSMDKTIFAYSVLTLLGAASAVLLVTAISETSVFIGMDIDNGAFVFGVMSFCDKLFCGLAIFGIQSLKPHSFHTLFYKDALGYTCGVSAVLGTLAILSIRLPNRSGASNASSASDQDAIAS